MADAWDKLEDANPSKSSSTKKTTKVKPKSKNKDFKAWDDLPESRGLTPSKEGDYTIETLSDLGVGASQGASDNLADEIYGAARAAVDQASGAESQYDEDYVKYRDEARDRFSLAKERSPYATGFGELGASFVAPSSWIPGGRGLKGLVRGAGEGAALSYAASEQEEGFDPNVLIGGALGAGSGMLGNLYQKFNKKTPTETRATALGFGKKEMQRGAGGRNVVDRIKDSNILHRGLVEWDPKKAKFIKKRRTISEIDELNDPFERRVVNRLNTAISGIQKEKEEVFGPIMQQKMVSEKELDDLFTEAAKEYIDRGIDKSIEKKIENVQKLSSNIRGSLLNDLSDKISFDSVGRPIPPMYNLQMVDKIKRKVQQDVNNYAKALGDVSEKDEMLRIVARKFKNLIEDKIDDPKFNDLNAKQHDFLTLLDPAQDQLDKMATAGSDARFSRPGVLETAWEGLTGEQEGALKRANFIEGYQKYAPQQIRRMMPEAVQKTPGVLFRQQIQENDRGGRRPQSISPAIRSIPEEVVKTPLPRNGEELLQKKNLTLAKFAQQAPEAYEDVKYLMEEDPEAFLELIPQIAQKVPHLFQRDKYNSFNGRIIDPTMMQRAISDIHQNKQMNNFQKSEAIQRILNKEPLN